MKIRAVIIDDEPLARQVIREFLHSHPEVEIAGETGNPVQALEIIRLENPDLLFLDIQMPEMNGFELLDQLSHPPTIIFCTAYDEFAIKAFEANAIDYLLKPFDQERFDRALEKARQFILGETPAPQMDRLLSYLTQQKQSMRFLVKKGNRMVAISPGELLWAEAQEDYSMLHTEKGNFLVSRTLQELEKRLSGSGFWRIHRSALVNGQAIKEIHPWSSGRYLLILKNGDRVESSKSGAQLIRKMLL